MIPPIPSGGIRGALAIGVLAVLAAILIAAAPAGASRAQVGHVIASLEAKFAPHRLPRRRPVPVSISFSGLLSTDDGSPLPRLHGIELALATGSSKLDNVGLPVCPRRQLLSTTKSQALARCADARVGRGDLQAVVEIPGQAPFSLLASVVAFNGGSRGARAVVGCWASPQSRPPPSSFQFSSGTAPAPWAPP